MSRCYRVSLARIDRFSVDGSVSMGFPMSSKDDKKVIGIAILLQSIGEQCRILTIGLGAMVVYIFPQARVLRHWHERIKPYRPLHPIRSVLIVCKANICRSPLAEAYLRSQLEAQEKSVAVCSTGLEAAAGKRASQTAITLAREYHLDLDTHATRMISADLVKKADLILVMEITQKDRIIRMHPEAADRVVLLGYFDPQGPLEIADPYGRSLEEFGVCFAQIRRSCDALSKVLPKAPSAA